jgi:hypothetical protein
MCVLVLCVCVCVLCVFVCVCARARVRVCVYTYTHTHTHTHAIGDYTAAITLDSSNAFAFYNRGISLKSKDCAMTFFLKYTKSVR